MQYMPYHNKYVEPCFNMALKLFAFMANVAALCTIVGGVLEFGFDLSEQLISELNFIDAPLYSTGCPPVVDRLAVHGHQRRLRDRPYNH